MKDSGLDTSITILVTGANGQLGHCLKNLGNKHPDLNFIYTDSSDLDISKLDSVIAFFKVNKQINYCINCAAYTAVDKAEMEVEKAFEINAFGPKNLAMVCNEQGTTLIHISTDFVFGGEKTEPYKETDEAKPISVYGASKLQGEQEIQKTLKEHFIIRTSWLYSEYGKNFMKTMLKLSKERDVINVVSDQIGSPTYAVDLAEVILLLIRLESKDYSIYHYSNDGSTSWYEFAKTIFNNQKTDIKLESIKTEDYKTLAKRPKYSVLDKTKISETFKLNVPHWQDSLIKCLKRAVEKI